MLFGLVNTLWLYPLLLTETEIGLVRTLINASVLFTSFAALGSVHIPIKFFPYFKDFENSHNGFLTFILLLAFVGYLLFLVLFFFFRSSISNIYLQIAPQLIEYLNYLPILTLFILFFSVFESYAICNQESVIGNFLKEFILRFLMFIGLILIFFKIISFFGFVNIVSISYAIILFILIFYISNKNFLFIKSPKAIFKNKRLKEMLTFGGFILMANASGSIMMNIDGLMLSAYEGLRSTGIYTIAYFIANIIEVPRRSLSQAVIPFISTANKEKDFGKLNLIYKSSSINQLIVGGLIFVLIWCNIDNLFQLIPNGEIYKEGKWVVFLLGIGKLFDLATGVNAEIVGTSKYYKFDLIFVVLLGIIGVGTNLYFIPIYGINGAAIATALSIFLVNTLRFAFIFIFLKLQPFTKHILTIIFMIVITIYISGSIIKLNNSFLDIFFRSFCLLILYLLPLFLLKVSTEINQTIFSIYNRFIKLKSE